MTDTNETVPLSKANKPELQAFARNTLGMTFDDDMTVPTMVAKVRQATNQTSIPAIPAGTEAIAAPDLADTPAAPITVITDDSSQERVKIIIHTTEEPGGDEPVFVSVNGRAQHIPRGEEVSIRRPYLEVLQHAQVWRYEPVKDAAGNLAGMKKREVPMYSFSHVA